VHLGRRSAAEAVSISPGIVAPQAGRLPRRALRPLMPARPFDTDLTVMLRKEREPEGARGSLQSNSSPEVQMRRPAAERYEPHPLVPENQRS
jgi:hypothetical protein